MNGVRSIFRRKGYLLTALAAAVLLAASSGTAWAQNVAAEITLVAPPTPVTEGDDVVITVRGTAMVDAEDTTVAHRTATVELILNDAAAGATFELDDGGQVNDATIVSNPTVTLVFAASSAASPGTMRTATATVTVRTNHDSDAEDEVVAVSLSTDGDDSSNIGGNAEDVMAASFRIDDDETQTYALTLDSAHLGAGSEPREGVGFVVNVEAKPPHYEGGDTLTLQLSANGGRATGYSAKGAEHTTAGRVAIGTDDPAGDVNLTTGAVNERAITISQDFNGPNVDGVGTDGNRVTDTITLEAHSGSAGRDNLAASIDVDVLDLQILPAASAITAVAKDEDGNVVTEIMEGGDPVFLTITVDRGRGGAERITDEELTVDIRAADARQVADYDLSESRIALETRSSGKQSNEADQKIELSARPDEDVGMEYLMLNLEVSGDSKIGTETSTGTFSIGIVDATDKKIEPKATEADYQGIMDAIDAGAGDEGLNPGETFMLMTSDLFDVKDGYTASYGVSVEGDSVSVSASSETITVNAVKAGDSVIVVTGTARMSSSSLEPSQTVSDVASLKFPVMVVDKMLVVMLEMPDNVMEGNIVEGMSYDIGVMANRMITEAEGSVEVMIMRDRAASDADDSDFEVSSATIMAGYDSATAELMVTEDDMPDGGTDDNMGETLVLYGMAGDMETNSLTFTIWDTAVPALPLFGQMLLALFLMLGGARLYRRRQQG